jgi:hypothetical protein
MSTFLGWEEDVIPSYLTSRRWDGTGQWKGLFGCEMMWSIGVFVFCHLDFFKYYKNKNDILTVLLNSLQPILSCLVSSRH